MKNSTLEVFVTLQKWMLHLRFERQSQLNLKMVNSLKARMKVVITVKIQWYRFVCGSKLSTESEIILHVISVGLRAIFFDDGLKYSTDILVLGLTQEFVLHHFVERLHTISSVDG